MSERVRVEAVPHIRIEVGGETIAETTAGYVVHETGLPDRYYLPRADVRAELGAGRGEGTCPWKGKWKHLDVAGIANGAWTYYETTAVCEPLRDFVAFYETKLRVIV
jgi:uncharacterized protein (DUF427 family)